MNEKVVINQKVSKQLQLICLCIILILLSVAMSYQKGIYFIVGIMGILFFGVGFLFLIKGLIRPKPILVIDEKGFIECSSAIANGKMVYWDEVKSIHISTITSQKVVSIELRDYNRFLEELTSWQRSVAKINHAGSFDAINISLNLTNRSCEEVYEIMNKYWLDHQAHENVTEEQSPGLV